MATMSRLSIRHRSLAGMTMVVVAGATIAVGPSYAAERPGSIRPAIDSGFADPGFNTDGKNFYSYRTGGNARGAFTYATSPSMNGPWKVIGKSSMSTGNLPAWVGPSSKGDYSMWAPSVVRPETGGYVMYYSANKKGANQRCVGIATATAATGPFRAQSKPAVCGPSGTEVIDASGVSIGGKRFLIYKYNSPLPGGKRRYEIRASPLNVAGDTLTPGRAKTLLQVDGGEVLEAPDVIDYGGKVYLFVSRGSYLNCTYRTEVWRSDALLTGTFRRTSDLMRTNSTGLCGPGGAEVRRMVEDGKVWMVFHAWKCANSVKDCRPNEKSEKRRYRAMYTALIGWDSQGVPRVLDRR